jgi:hypothetical protein
MGIVGAEVDDSRDSSWKCCFMTWLYLATKPFHMGVDVDGLACPLHRPTTYSRQTRGHGLLPGTALSRRCSGQWHLSRGCETHRFGYLVES